MRAINNSGYTTLFCLSLLCILSLFLPCQALSQPKCTKLEDGVQRCIRKDAVDKPWFFQLVEELFDVVLPGKNKLPFGRSVAFF